MQGQDTEIFKGKTFSGLLKDIYDNSRQKERQITILIGELKPLIKTVADAGIVIPLIAEYMDIAVQNDEHLVKMAAIVQRSIANANKQLSVSEYETVLTSAEKQAIIDEVKQLQITSTKVKPSIRKTNAVKKLAQKNKVKVQTSLSEDIEEDVKEIFK